MWKTEGGISVSLFRADHYTGVVKIFPWGISVSKEQLTQLQNIHKMAFILKTLSIHIDASPASLPHVEVLRFSDNSCHEFHQVNWLLYNIYSPIYL